jgi:ribosomal protein S18 acetylase RimI-like enzyme
MRQGENKEHLLVMDVARATAVYRNYCEMWRRVGALAPPGSVFEVVPRPDMLLIRSHHAPRVPHMVLDPGVLDADAPRWVAALVREMAGEPVSLMIGIPPGEEQSGLVTALQAEGFMRAARPNVAMDRILATPDDAESDPAIALAAGEAGLEEARALLGTIFGLPSTVFAFYTPPEVVRTYVLRQEGVPVAAACLCPFSSSAGIYSVGVLPSMRGQGYARRLVLHALREAAALGRTSIGLSCEQALVPFYRRFGFTACWQLVSYWLEAWWR